MVGAFTHQTEGSVLIIDGDFKCVAVDERHVERHAQLGRLLVGVTVNVPRIALESHGDKDRFWKLFDERSARVPFLREYLNICVS